MAGILDIFKRLFHHRKQQRYFVGDGTFVIISPGDSEHREKEVQVIDISRGGMAFIYKGSPSDLEKTGILKLLAKDPPFRRERIKFDTVSDIPAPESAQTSENFRRRGVKFKWLGSYEGSALSNLIDEIKICEK